MAEFADCYCESGNAQSGNEMKDEQFMQLFFKAENQKLMLYSLQKVQLEKGAETVFDQR